MFEVNTSGAFRSDRNKTGGLRDRGRVKVKSSPEHLKNSLIFPVQRVYRVVLCLIYVSLLSLRFVQEILLIVSI